MKRALTIFATLSCATVWAASASAADSYYKTKADARIGRLTQGPAPRAGEVPNVGGDNCAAAVVMNPGVGATFNDTGTTIGANNTVNNVQAGCEEYTQVAGPDVIYTFTLGPVAARGNPMTITLTPNAAWDPAIYNLSTAGVGCPAGTGNVVTNCVNGADSGLANTPETITDAEMDAMVAGTYFLFVDSFYPTGTLSGGPYTLAFGIGPLPVELIDMSIE
jgi:hypothetical protein